MNEILEQALLYDFYGELLTEHQKRIYEQFVIEDLSLSEIAEEEGISRQGVHDLVKRCNKALIGYEDKLHLVEKFVNVKKRLEEMNQILEASEHNSIEKYELVESIKNISKEIIEEL
ncbi:MAG: DNA-binding protein [Eubacteriales bacterium]